MLAGFLKFVFVQSMIFIMILLGLHLSMYMLACVDPYPKMDQMTFAEYLELSTWQQLAAAPWPHYLYFGNPDGGWEEWLQYLRLHLEMGSLLITNPRRVWGSFTRLSVTF